MSTQATRCETAGKMTASTLHNRLAARIRDDQAHKLATTPNADLGGSSPLDALAQGQDAAVLALVKNLELQEKVRSEFMPTFPHEFSPIDYQAEL